MTRVLMLDDRQAIVLYSALREAYFEAWHQIRMLGRQAEPTPQDLCCEVHKARWEARKEVYESLVRMCDEIQALRDHMGDPKEPDVEPKEGLTDGKHS